MALMESQFSTFNVTKLVKKGSNRSRTSSTTGSSNSTRSFGVGGDTLKGLRLFYGDGIKERWQAKLQVGQINGVLEVLVPWKMM
ncbi:uncharacterized protein HKW66_Vig0247710 [Vigna angularis]|uniref:Uncharacterized protein n=1 Tax=Phaseolus angularis TaxID=3914 RepID=A0A8T0KUI2_PHAAN|nr:uncharacterized protein HKW66_Vig0247710 [Vigna angularis]